MTGSISNGGVLPQNNSTPADGYHKFTLDYFLYDKYGNPMANRSIWMSTNLSGEETPTLYTSDSYGLIRLYYGPKISILTSNITAIAKDNASVNKNLIANFVSSGNVSNLILVITPETMASRDTDPSTTRSARVVGTITDAMGNSGNW